MQTVTFQCGHCGNLMAVGTDFVGQQVRCPHCQQVVVAPAPVSTPAPEPPAPASAPIPAPMPTETAAFQPAAPGDHEDIFSPAPPSDDLFGQNDSPRLEIPAPAPASPPATFPSWFPQEPAAPAPDLHLTSTLALPDGPPAAPEPVLAPTPVDQPDAETTPWMGSPTGDGAESPAAVVTRPSRSRSDSGALFIPLVFVPLVFYAILATGLVAYLYYQVKWRPSTNPLEQLPDGGDVPGVQKVQPGSVLRYNPRLPSYPLSPRLRTALGQPVRVGDLEVTPERVERRRVSVVVEGFKPEPCQGDSLVLHLRVKNVAPDQAFVPLDNYFDRRWKQGDGLPPFTYLEAGGQKFFGGPAPWVTTGQSRRDQVNRQYLADRPLTENERLRPGQELKTWVCTDGDDPRMPPLLNRYHGSLLWRVHVRRGLVAVHGRDISATAVIGVEFTDGDFRKAG